MRFKGNCSHLCFLSLLQSFQFLPSSAKQSTYSWHLCEKAQWRAPCYSLLCIWVSCHLWNSACRLFKFNQFLNIYPSPTEEFSTSILPFSLLFHCLLPSIHDLFITDSHFWHQLMPQHRRTTWLVSVQRSQLFVVCLTLSCTKTQRIYYLFSLTHYSLLLSRQV